MHLVLTKVKQCRGDFWVLSAEWIRWSFRFLFLGKMTMTRRLVSLGLTLPRRKCDWLISVDICWWLGSNVTIKGMFLSVTSLGRVLSRLSLSRDAALV